MGFPLTPSGASTGSALSSGADGPADFNGVDAVTGYTLAGSTYTGTALKQFAAVTIAAGVTVIPPVVDGQAVLVAITIQNDGRICAPGEDAVADAGGYGFNSGAAGGNGATGHDTDGGPGDGIAASGGGGNGGSGGAASGHAAGSGGTATQSAGYVASDPYMAITNRDAGTVLTGGAGGGAGGGKAAIPETPATGNLDLNSIGPGNLGEYFTLYGISYMFQMGATPVPGYVIIDASDPGFAAHNGTFTAAVINATDAANVTAVGEDVTNQVALTAAAGKPGTAGNVAIGGTLSLPVTGMSGGTAAVAGGTGGGGGGGGGQLFVGAESITGTGQIDTNGGNGGNGSGADAGGGGGGGGGRTKTRGRVANSQTVEARGGAAGTGPTNNGSDGANGTVTQF